MSYNPQFVKIATMRAMYKISEVPSAQEATSRSNKDAKTVAQKATEIAIEGSSVPAVSKAVRGARKSSILRAVPKALPLAKKVVPFLGVTQDAVAHATTGKHPVLDYDYDSSTPIDIAMDIIDSPTNPYAAGRTVGQAARAVKAVDRKLDEQMQKHVTPSRLENMVRALSGFY
jgi:hypothetical protein